MHLLYDSDSACLHFYSIPLPIQFQCIKQIIHKYYKVELTQHIQQAKIITFNKLFKHNFYQMIPNKNEKIPTTWSEIVNQVESANQQQLSYIQLQQKLRKQAYKNSLDEQVKLKHQNYYSQRKKAQEARKQIQRLAAQQKNQLMKKKQVRKQFQQSFGQENKKLLDNIQSDKIQLNKANNMQDSPFFKLIDHENQRKMKLKQKFKYQNHLNDIQTKIREDAVRRQKQQEDKVSKKFANHIQGQHLSRQTNRKNFISRYLNTKDSDKYRIQKDYRQYLNQQVTENRNLRSRQKQDVSQRIQSLNRNYNNDSSPAFLGRIPAEHDRQRQMQYIDKNLGINSYSSRVSTQQGYQRSNIHQRAHSEFRTKTSELPKHQQAGNTDRKGPDSLNKYEKQLEFVLPSLDRWKAEQAPNNINIKVQTRQENTSGNSRTRQNASSQKMKTQQSNIQSNSQSNSRSNHTNRSFLQYNFITGQDKHIFL